MKLSAYTIAKNCTDITDLRDGIKEIEDYFSKTTMPKRTKSSYIRYFKLHEKLKKYEIN